MRRLVILALFALTGPARAGDIVGYVPGDPTSIATYDRFPNGIGSPTPNTSGSFVGAGLDLSGIGWITGGQDAAITLMAARSVSNPSQVVGQYVVGAFHVGLGGSVTFADNTGALTSYTVAATQRLTTTVNGTPTPSDVIIGRLAGPVTTAVKPLPLADLTIASAAGVTAYAYGFNTTYGADRRQLGVANLSGVGLASFPGNDSPTAAAVWQQTAQPGSVRLTGGDSGGPLITRGLNNQTALIGAHNGVAGVTSTSSFLPYDEYVTQINAFMQPDGYQVVFVPVPEPAGLLTAAGLGVLAVRRLRRAA